MFCFQDANILGGRSPQRLSDCRQLGTLPMVLLPFLILFRSEPVKFAAMLFEQGLDRVALRLHGVAVFPERAQLGDDLITLADGATRVLLSRRQYPRGSQPPAPL